MALPRFQYHEPTSLAEACQMIQEYGETAALLAGGTDLLVKMKNRELRPQNIVSLVELEEIKQISVTGRHTSIGACCTISQIADSEAIRSVFPALSSGAEHLGSPAVRNLGTIGGNVVTASPAADLPPALAAYGTKARLKQGEQERFLSLDQIFRGPGATHIRKDEILADLHLKKPPKCSGAGFFKLGHRNALQCSIINGACYIALDPQTGKIEKARIILGAVAPTLVRASSAEKLLMGEKPGKELFLEAGMAAVGDCNPIDDLRGSAEYRRDMIQVLTSRTLHTSLNEIRKSIART
ncbi:FAD binding domain-containing protein [Desulfococcaceae bacterium HSG9]|nr:FAD binding domain-containing protein [Desulfococcaceae bacterium HSG9]